MGVRGFYVSAPDYVRAEIAEIVKLAREAAIYPRPNSDPAKICRTIRPARPSTTQWSSKARRPLQTKLVIAETTARPGAERAERLTEES